MDALLWLRALTDQSVYVGNTDFQFYSIDRYSGIPDWAYSCSGEVDGGSRGVDGWVWQLDGSGRLHRVALETGLGAAFASGVEEVLMVSVVTRRSTGTIAVACC